MRRGSHVVVMAAAATGVSMPCGYRYYRSSSHSSLLYNPAVCPIRGSMSTSYVSTGTMMTVTTALRMQRHTFFAQSLMLSPKKKGQRQTAATKKKKKKTPSKESSGTQEARGSISNTTESLKEAARAHEEEEEDEEEIDPPSRPTERVQHESPAAPPTSSMPSRKNPLFFTEKNTNESTEELPWRYEDVDDKGLTSLDRIYNSEQERIRKLCDAPLPELPDDGNYKPHFFVGFAHYNYRLRDQYRAVLAAMLGVPVSDVRISVGWSGRFDVSRFRGCQKVCGVTVTSLNDSSNSTHIAAATERLVSLAKQRKDDRLLRIQLVDASPAIPEVEFERRNKRVDSLNAILNLVAREHQVYILHEDDDNKNHVGSLTPSQEHKKATMASWLKAFRDRQVEPKLESVTEFFKRVEGKDASSNKEEQREQQTTKVVEGEEAAASSSSSSSSTTYEMNLLLLAAISKTAHSLGRLPAVYINGMHVGSTYQMNYLIKNAVALDAVLLHPNDITFEQKFRSRLSSGRPRQDTLAADAVDAGTGRVHS